MNGGPSPSIRLNPAAGAPSHDRALSCHDQIARTLALQILDGSIRPGEKLPPEEALMSRFAVSRTALREALRTLAAKGFLRVRTRVGTTITDPTSWSYFDQELLSWILESKPRLPVQRHLDAVRNALEPAAASLAAIYRDQGDLQSLTVISADLGADDLAIETLMRTLMSLHIVIGRASQNPFLQSFSGAAAICLTRTAWSPSVDVALGRALGARLCTGIAKADAAAAAAAMARLLVFEEGAV
jgi:DNA-binding FadR family transcriptional regulator